jgi:hypothetical protein
MSQNYDYRVVAQMHLNVYDQTLKLIEEMNNKTTSSSISNQTAPSQNSKPEIIDAEI